MLFREISSEIKHLKHEDEFDYIRLLIFILMIDIWLEAHFYLYLKVYRYIPRQKDSNWDGFFLLLFLKEYFQLTKQSPEIFIGI